MTTHIAGRDSYGHFVEFSLPMEGKFRSAMPNAALARCCAAAPDMLAALERIAAGDPNHAHFATLAIGEARAAIAKATEPQS